MLRGSVIRGERVIPSRRPRGRTPPSAAFHIAFHISDLEVFWFVRVRNRSGLRNRREGIGMEWENGMVKYGMIWYSMVLRDMEYSMAWHGMEWSGKGRAQDPLEA